jgi:hypothetical protein
LCFANLAAFTPAQDLRELLLECSLAQLRIRWILFREIFVPLDSVGGLCKACALELLPNGSSKRFCGSKWCLACCSRGFRFRFACLFACFFAAFSIGFTWRRFKVPYV